MNSRTGRSRSGWCAGRRPFGRKVSSSESTSPQNQRLRTPTRYGGCGSKRPPLTLLDEQRRKVDAGVDRELQRAPEPPVDLHQLRHAVADVALELDHRHAVPAELVEQPGRVVARARVERRRSRRAR